MGKKGYGSSHMIYNDIGRRIAEIKAEYHKDRNKMCIKCDNNNLGWCTTYSKWCDQAQKICKIKRTGWNDIGNK